MKNPKIKKLLFYTHSNIKLAKKVAKLSNLQIGKAIIKKFADGEISILIKEKIKNKEIYILGSTFPPTNNLVELLILIHTIKVNGAKKINLIIPYFGYAKADHIDPPGSTLAAKLMVKLIEQAGTDKIIALDLHSPLVEKFFKKPLIHLSAIELLANYFKKQKIKNLAVASPDLGGIKRATKFAKILKIKQIISIKKYRPSFDRVKIKQISGNINDKNVIIVDDMIQSGKTIIKATQALKRKGAKNIYVAISHLIFTGPSIDLLKKNKNIKQIIFTDSSSPKSKLVSKFKQLSIANLLSSKIK